MDFLSREAGMLWLVAGQHVRVRAQARHLPDKLKQADVDRLSFLIVTVLMLHRFVSRDKTHLCHG